MCAMQLTKKNNWQRKERQLSTLHNKRIETTMSDINADISTADSAVVLSEISTPPPIISSSSSPSTAIDDETKRRRILSKLWGKGNKSSHKVRELENSTTNTIIDSSIHNDQDQQQYTDHLSSNNDSKSTIEDNSNSINSKPLAVVKPIVMAKSGLTASTTRVDSETSSTTIPQINEATPSSLITAVSPDEKSSKKKKSHKHESSKKKKTTKDKSRERDRSKDRRHHQTDEKSSKKSSSSSKTHREEQNEEISLNDNHHKSSHYHSSTTSSTSNNKRQSPANHIDHSDEKSSRSTTSKKDKPSRRDSRSPSPSRSRHSITNRDRSETKRSPSPKRVERSSTTTSSKSNRRQTDPVGNSKSTNSISPTDSHSNQAHKTRTSNENVTVPMKTQKSHENSPRSSSSSNRQEKPKVMSTNHEDSSSHRRKLSSSQHDRRSSSRHRSRSKEDKTNRKPTEISNTEETPTNKTKINRDKDSTTAHEKKSSRGSPIPSNSTKHRRKSSSDHHHHQYDRHDSPSEYDRRNDDHRHRHSQHSNTHYVHHHHHHHYQSTSSRYRHYRRSPSPRYHRSRYFSSTSSSFSPSPRRRSPTRTSSSSSRSSSYSSISRTSSSRSSSRNPHHYYSRHRQEKKFRRSPTLEKLFLKASESIESVSTQRNPNQPSTAHLIPVQTSSTTSELQVTSPINSLSDPQTFYPERFLGFSAPPPPFIAQPPQRCLKEITTDSSTLRRPIFNELPPSTSSMIEEVSPLKSMQSTDLPNNLSVRSGRPARVSRFSDIAPTVSSESTSNTNLSVDTVLNYTQISDNINCLPSTRRQQKRHNREVMECECTTSEYDRSRGIKACGSECLNRILLIECSSNCPCEQWCTNRRFQRRSYASHKLALFKTEMKGYGLRTISSIRKGRFLVEYVGEVVDMDELARRSKKYKRDGNIHQYVMSLIHGTVIDSTIKGNWARFINHSCEPNCVAEKWLVNGEYRMGIFAKRDLDSNEEINIDYRFETFGSVDLASEKCYCGAPTCRGTISIKSNNNNQSNKRQTRRQAIDDDELLDCLLDDETNEYITPKTIEEVRQLIQIMSRTDSENVRTIELNLIRKSSQKHAELPRLFLECNGLRVLCSWMKDILIDDNEQQQYSQEFRYHLLDFIHTVLPIKDRTILMKNGLLDLVYRKLQLPSSTANVGENTDQEQIHQLVDSMLNHLDNPIITKLFHIYSSWMSLKERYIIPKRKESAQAADHHHHHHHRHHHHSSKHSYEENDSRSNFSTRSLSSQVKSTERYSERRSFVVRDLPRTQEQQLSKDERRKLFEQQFEDEEKARAAAAAGAMNGESPGGQNEPPHKKQRTSDGIDPISSNISPQAETSSMSHQQQIEQMYTIHRYLSQIPIDYIRSYLGSIGQPIPGSNVSSVKGEPPVPAPARPDDEVELSRIIRLPPGWSVAMCPSDSSVYFYNAETIKSSWIPPILEIPTENSDAPLDLSPVSFAQITEQRRPHHQSSSTSRSVSKLLKHSHRHNRHHHQHIISHAKRKRPIGMESTATIKEEANLPSIEDATIIDTDEQIKDEEINEKFQIESIEKQSAVVPKAAIDADNDFDMATITKDTSDLNDHADEHTLSSDSKTLSSSIKLNRDLLRKNISQHVHAILKPYTKRTCKQGRIVSTDDIKYLVKKFTLAVLDKEIEKARNDGTGLPPVLTERVRLKTEMYVKKYMNKMGSVFQRHDPTGHSSSQLPSITTATSNSE